MFNLHEKQRQSAATDRKMIRATVSALAAVLLAAGAVNVAATQASSSRTPKHSPRRSVIRTAATGPSLLSTLAQTYSVLSESTAASKATIPQAISDSGEMQRAQARFGLEIGQARAVEGPSGMQSWLIPGRSGYCVVNSIPAHDESLTSYCSDSLPAGGFLGFDNSGPSGEVIGGFVPNGNTSVELTDADGTRSITVSGNAMFAAADGAVSLHDTGIDGNAATQDLG